MYINLGDEGDADAAQSFSNSVLDIFYRERAQVGLGNKLDRKGLHVALQSQCVCVFVCVYMLYTHIVYLYYTNVYYT
jgi:hypothetical protein